MTGRVLVGFHELIAEPMQAGKRMLACRGNRNRKQGKP